MDKWNTVWIVNAECVIPVAAIVSASRWRLYIFDRNLPLHVFMSLHIAYRRQLHIYQLTNLAVGLHYKGQSALSTALWKLLGCIQVVYLIHCTAFRRQKPCFPNSVFVTTVNSTWIWRLCSVRRQNVNRAVCLACTELLDDHIRSCGHHGSFWCLWCPISTP